MPGTTAESAKNTAAKNHREIATEDTALDRSYAEIGIPAVAAAARYQGTAKNPAYAPCSTKWRDLIAEAAA